MVSVRYRIDLRRHCAKVESVGYRIDWCSCTMSWLVEMELQGLEFDRWSNLPPDDLVVSVVHPSISNGPIAKVIDVPLIKEIATVCVIYADVCFYIDKLEL